MDAKDGRVILFVGVAGMVAAALCVRRMRATALRAGAAVHPHGRKFADALGDAAALDRMAGSFSSCLFSAPRTLSRKPKAA